MFLEPCFTLILTDFIIRVCTIRNERHISQKLEPLRILITVMSITRLIVAIPDLFINIDKSVLLKIEGLTRYEMVMENSIAY
jgi:hypothetical protein